MYLNATSYKLPHTTHHTTKTFTYQMNGVPLKSVEKIKYLGVGLRQLCQHNFEHNRLAKASSIMPT